MTFISVIEIKLSIGEGAEALFVSLRSESAEYFGEIHSFQMAEVNIACQGRKLSTIADPCSEIMINTRIRVL